MPLVAPLVMALATGCSSDLEMGFEKPFGPVRSAEWINTTWGDGVGYHELVLSSEMGLCRKTRALYKGYLNATLDYRDSDMDACEVKREYVLRMGEAFQQRYPALSGELVMGLLDGNSPEEGHFDRWAPARTGRFFGYYDERPERTLYDAEIEVAEAVDCSQDDWSEQWAAASAAARVPFEGNVATLGSGQWAIRDGQLDILKATEDRRARGTFDAGLATYDDTDTLISIEGQFNCDFCKVDISELSEEDMLVGGIAVGDGYGIYMLPF